MVTATIGKNSFSLPSLEPIEVSNQCGICCLLSCHVYLYSKALKEVGIGTVTIERFIFINSRTIATHWRATEYKVQDRLPCCDNFPLSTQFCP